MLPSLPRFLFIEINKRCNLRCGHCHFWKLDDHDMANYMSNERISELIAEFAVLSDRKGVVVSCGGEPMLDMDRYFTVSKSAHANGIRFFSVTNGTHIPDKRAAEQLVNYGPDEITVSLNSHRAELHDRTRGLKGAFETTVAGIRRLVEANKEWPEDSSRNKIYVMTIVAEYNYRDLPDFYEWALNDLGVDKLKMNILQPTFGNEAGSPDVFYNNAFVRDPDALITILKECDKRFGLNLNPAWLDNVHMYHRTMLNKMLPMSNGWDLTTLEAICNTYERNIMVDAYGRAKLCFSEKYRGEQLSGPGDLTNFWNGAQDIRDAMQGCKAPCGISHSVRREPATKRLPVVG